ncbi:MAG TPA: iron-sulfur cluster assembly scaffold protein [Rhizomicrobium sp.]|jgi:nitrogen fixation NifU-like protein|nr:iron-sulfur cluster assembly scaffold protein [Rhizomicrobium sp.]
MSDPLYKKELLRLAADAHGAGTLPAPHLTGTAFNPACSDRVTMHVRLDENGRIDVLAQETKACVLAQASASILGRDAPHHARAELEQLRSEVASMLKGDLSPSGAYTVFDGVADHASRHKCVLLPFDALLNAFNG